jgi:two-component system, OmpR family, copper resistance phosphate regulon response regulator CusR
MKILLVEDEIHTAAHLRRGLLENGFAVDVASRSGAFAMASRSQYDLLILDVKSGSAQISNFRSIGPAPVLLLADPNALQPDGGPHPAGNYLRKPFGFSEFLAQVRRLLPWADAANPLVGRIADLELDLERHRTTRAGRRLDLTPKEFLLLCLLVRNAGKVLSRSFIADQVWDINFESHTNFVDVHIRRLRSKVDDPFPNKLIHTVRGAGYVLEDRMPAE